MGHRLLLNFARLQLAGHHKMGSTLITIPCSPVARARPQRKRTCKNGFTTWSFEPCNMFPRCGAAGWPSNCCDGLVWRWPAASMRYGTSWHTTKPQACLQRLRVHQALQAQYCFLCLGMGWPSRFLECLRKRLRSMASEQAKSVPILRSPCSPRGFLPVLVSASAPP